MKSKTAPSARAMALLLASLLLAGFITACQPNPTTLSVVNKGDGKLMEKIKQTAVLQPAATGGDVSAAPGPAKTLRESLNIPEKVSAEFTSDNAAVSFRIDAPVEIPETAAVPVAAAVAAPFTQAQVDKLVEVLVGGAELYDLMAMTREEIQRQIILVKADIAAAEKNQKTEDDRTWLRKCQANLEYYQKLLADTPESAGRAPVTSKLVDRQEGSEHTQQLEASCEVGGRRMALTVYNGANSGAFLAEAGEDGISGKSFAILSGGSGLASPKGVALTRAEAERKAGEIASALDPDLMLAAVGVAATPDRSEYVWQMIYTRPVNGFPTPYELTENGEGGAGDAVTQSVFYEKIVISMDDTGVAGFAWLAPLAVTGVINGNVALLGFDEVQRTAEKMLKTKYSEFFSEVRGNPESMAVTVDRVTLGLMRVSVKDRPGQYMLMPVWDFFGDYSFKLSEKDEKEAKDKKGKTGWDKRKFLSMLTINAIDGSVVDRYLGY